MRTLVLGAGVLLVVALAVFLGIGKWRNMRSDRDLPKRLGINIQQEASGVTYTQSHGGHMIFKIHASRAEQLKNGHSLLHDVTIEFYAKDGRTVDRIAGSDFEYNQKTGIASAAGKVEITLTRPLGEPKGSVAEGGGHKAPSIPSSAAGAIHVQTSGLSFNENTGVATTAEKVDFTMAKGSGSAMGATYDSQQGYLTLDRAVKLHTERGGQPVAIYAQHAEFERDAETCRMLEATAEYKGGQTSAGSAKILFRSDGSAKRLDATNGFKLADGGGGQIAAPSGWLEFNAYNQPRQGHLAGGVTLNSASADRQLRGSARSADFAFSPQGELRLMTFHQGVQMHSERESPGNAHEAALRVTRTWRSPMASVDFHPAGPGRVEPAELHGSGGVVVTTETRRGNEAPVPSRLVADVVTGSFGPDAELTGLTGTGHASMEETTAQGARQTASADKLVARFEPAATQKAGKDKGAAGIQSAVLDGNVTFVQTPAAKHGAQAEGPLKAAAGRAVYQSAGEWLHLTKNPRVENGGMQLTANKIDVSQESQKGFAYGDVKATWLGDMPGARATKTTGGNVAFGGQGPAHVISDEAQFSQESGEAIFRGHARLWQEANSIAAPEIVLNRSKSTLVARSGIRSEPVLAVLLSTAEPSAGLKRSSISQGETGRQPPAIIRVRGGVFTYSDVEHRAVIVGGGLGPVEAMTSGATCTARQIVLLVRPREAGGAQAPEVERITASGDVVVRSQGRRGTGTELVYSGETGEYVLTGTPAAPPRLIDPARGTVTGTALIFNSRDDSVSIEGRGRETRTETVVPR